MTVLTAYEPLLYSGNGATQSFDVTWPFFTGSLVVTRIVSGVETELTINVDYTVTGGTDGEGKPGLGSVIFGTAPASGTQIRIERDTPLTQGSTWDESDNFPQAVVEAGFDKSILIAQEIAGKDWSGPKGDQGDVGPANTLSIGTVTKGDDADASITGAAPSQILNLVLPKGDQGDPGLKPVQVDELTDRDAYDDEDEGFSVLVSDTGDGRAAIYSKNSNASADWSDPAYVTGPSGATDVPDTTGIGNVVGWGAADGTALSDLGAPGDFIVNSGGLSNFAINLFKDSGRLSAEGGGFFTGAYAFPTSYLGSVNGTTNAAVGKFIYDNTDYGGAGGTMEPEVKDLIDKIRDPAFRRYNPEFFVARLTMGSGTTSVVSFESVNYYLSLRTELGPYPSSCTFFCYLRAETARIVIRRYTGMIFYKDGTLVPGGTHIPIDPAEGWVAVLIQWSKNPYNTFGHNPTPLTIQARSGVSDTYLIACPTLMGGITNVDQNIGLVPSINRWLV